MANINQPTVILASQSMKEPTTNTERGHYAQNQKKNKTNNHSNCRATHTHTPMHNSNFRQKGRNDDEPNVKAIPITKFLVRPNLWRYSGRKVDLIKKMEDFLRGGEASEALLSIENLQKRFSTDGRPP